MSSKQVAPAHDGDKIPTMAGMDMVGAISVKALESAMPAKTAKRLGDKVDL